MINLESHERIIFSNGISVTGDKITTIADNCLNLIKEELNNKDIPCSFEICQAIIKEIDIRLYTKTF